MTPGDYFMEPSPSVQGLANVAAEGISKEAKDVEEGRLAGAVSADNNEKWRKFREVNVLERLVVFDLYALQLHVIFRGSGVGKEEDSRRASSPSLLYRGAC